MRGTIWFAVLATVGIMAVAGQLRLPSTDLDLQGLIASTDGACAHLWSGIEGTLHEAGRALAGWGLTTPLADVTVATPLELWILLLIVPVALAGIADDLITRRALRSWRPRSVRASRMRPWGRPSWLGRGPTGVEERTETEMARRKRMPIDVLRAQIGERDAEQPSAVTAGRAFRPAVPSGLSRWVGERPASPIPVESLG